MTALDRACEILFDEQATCVVISGDDAYISHERGVKPLLKLLDEKRDVVGASAADKVVGKAAAMIYVLLGIKELHAYVISSLAVEFLEAHNVSVRYDKLVPMIRNRTDTGFCPMEQATKNISEPNEALLAIRKRLSELEK